MREDTGEPQKIKHYMGTSDEQVQQIFGRLSIHKSW